MASPLRVPASESMSEMLLGGVSAHCPCHMASPLSQDRQVLLAPLGDLSQKKAVC